MSDPFVTAAEFSRFLGLNEPDDLARMQMHLEMASALIRRYCDQELSRVTDETVVLAPVSRPTLLLLERPVVVDSNLRVTSVTVNGSLITDYWCEPGPGILHRGTITGTIGTDWISGATVVYSHGYAESDEEYKAIKAVCLAAAARAFTLNERSASEAMGATIMESAGYAPEVFLTQGEKWQLMDLGKVGVG